MIGHRVVLRPRSFIEIGDLTLVLIRTHAPAFAWLLPWVVVPAVVAYTLHAFEGWEDGPAIALELALTGITSGVYTILCGDLMLQETVALKSVQGRFLRHFISYVIARLAGWMLAALLCGGTYFAAIFVPEGALLERGSIGATFSRSRALMRAAPGRWIAFGITVLVLSAAGAFGAELFHTALRELFGLQVTGLIESGEKLSWAPFLGIALVQPYLAAMRFLLYIDCRTRREGWDLQVQFGALVTAADSPLRHRHVSGEVAA